MKITDSFEEIGARTIDARNRLTVGEILKGPQGEKVFEVYAEQSTPAAYRIFWY